MNYAHTCIQMNTLTFSSTHIPFGSIVNAHAQVGALSLAYTTPSVIPLFKSDLYAPQSALSFPMHMANDRLVDKATHMGFCYRELANRQKLTYQ